MPNGGEVEFPDGCFLESGAIGMFNIGKAVTAETERLGWQVSGSALGAGSFCCVSGVLSFPLTFSQTTHH